MSFILDALRKSEHERERKALPGLAEVPVVRQDRRKVPVAMIAIGALLAINLLVLLVVLLRDDAPESEAAPAATTAASGSGATANGAGPPSTGAPSGTMGATAAAPPAPAAPRASADVRPLQAEIAATDEAAPPYQDTPPVPREPTLDGGARVQRAPIATDGSVVRSTVPLDVVRASAEAARRPAGPERDTGTAGVPSINDLAPQATAGLPALAINLHVYAGDPRQDFVVLNGRRYQQGAQLQEGPTLEQITSDGVVLNHRGLRFLLPRQ